MSLGRTMRRSRWEGARAAASDRGLLRVMTWNVLADGLAQHGNFAHIKEPARELSWEARAPGILATIESAGADVVCLQECNHWHDTFEPHLCIAGPWSGVHTCAGTAAERLGGDADGEAVLLRRSRLELLSSRVVRFQPDTTQRGIIVLARDLAAPLGASGRPAVWVIATAHFKAKTGPGPAATRLVQARAWASYVGAAVSSLRASGSAVCGVVMAGDLNEPPIESVGVQPGEPVRACLHEAVEAKGEEGEDAASAAKRALSAAAQATPGPAGAEGVYATLHAWPGLRLRSAYARVGGGDGATLAVEEGLSTFKVRSAEVGSAARAAAAAAVAAQAAVAPGEADEASARKPKSVARIIDYIWLGAGASAHSVLELPEREAIGEEGLPCASMPSDHVPLVADVAASAEP
ncbi:hypothetical protein FNF31_04519 [Cafeteria roenbergensis]|nr:hypothetical protein FNF31_04519 [Cafeteria roenbergensis]KAA0171016.1 hypothetical protein FNF28_01021 [Cafeteria roenbergensis]